MCMLSREINGIPIHLVGALFTGYTRKVYVIALSSFLHDKVRKIIIEITCQACMTEGTAKIQRFPILENKRLMFLYSGTISIA